MSSTWLSGGESSPSSITSGPVSPAGSAKTDKFLLTNNVNTNENMEVEINKKNYSK